MSNTHRYIHLKPHLLTSVSKLKKLLVWVVRRLPETLQVQLPLLSLSAQWIAPTFWSHLAACLTTARRYKFCEPLKPCQISFIPSQFSLAAWIPFPWEVRTRGHVFFPNTRKLSRDMAALLPFIPFSLVKGIMGCHSEIISTRDAFATEAYLISKGKLSSPDFGPLGVEETTCKHADIWPHVNWLTCYPYLHISAH